MATHHSRCRLASLVLLLVLSVSCASAQRPRALAVAVSKDPATHQYVAHLRQRTPLVPVPATVDLGGSFFWVNCERGFSSSSSRPVPCNSARCAAAGTQQCSGDTNPTCGFTPYNPFIRTSTADDLYEDVLVVPSTDGAKPGPPAAAPRVLFGCSPTFLAKGLARGAQGVVGLGRNRAALPSQLAAAFSLRRRFAICLSSSVGAAFFGGGPYSLRPGLDAYYLGSTPLLVNPHSLRTGPSGQPSDEYFVGVTSLRVDGVPIPEVNASLLNIDRKTGQGGTRFSTVDQYTILESSVFRAVAAAFAKAGGLRAVKPVAPFGFCFDPAAAGSSPVVPSIDLVLQNDEVFWRMYEESLVVKISPRVSCLAFVVAGPFQQSTIVIGGHQLEDHLLEFDLAASRLNFSPPLRFAKASCADFNFTSILS